jgi:hypothetical protein
VVVEVLVCVDLLAEAGALFQDLLGLRGVFPEVGVGGALFDRLEAPESVALLKDDLGARRGGP